MTDDVKLPVAGNVPKKWVYGGAAVAGIYVAYAWWRSRQAAAGGDGFVYDPATGANGPSDLGYDNPNPVQTPDFDTPKAPTNNQEWMERALEKLGNIGIEPAGANGALAKYLNRQQLTDAEADLVVRAWGLVGKPPEGPTSFTKVPPTVGPPNPNPTPTPNPAGSLGWSVSIPAGWGGQGTSAIMNNLLKRFGYTTSTADRNKVWYHAKNAGVRAKYKDNWTKLRSGDVVWVPLGPKPPANTTAPGPG